jgi:hypothetical protein
MKVGIMQPYFLPYIGYFQLISAVDRFVVYDNIKYTKKGWINRNRLLQNHSDAVFSLPVKKDSDSLDVRERRLAEDFNRQKLVNQFVGAYRGAPYFDSGIELVRNIVLNPEVDLFGYLHSSIVAVCRHLSIETRIDISSHVPADHGARGEDRVLSICKSLGATVYINTMGGTELYSRPHFADQGIELKFIRSRPFAYQQRGSHFVPWLSIVDVIMFNPVDKIRDSLLTNFELV